MRGNGRTMQFIMSRRVQCQQGIAQLWLKGLIVTMHAGRRGVALIKTRDYRIDAIKAGAGHQPDERAGHAAAYSNVESVAPRSVAMVGATDHPTSFGGRVFQQMTGFGFPGKIYPVNPRLKDINGLKCYPGIKDLPETPDHVGIVVSSERVFDVLADCAAIGVRHATVFSGGFAETGTAEGRERQKRLIEFGRESGIRFMGPNCNGIVNFIDRFAMTSTAAIRGVHAKAGDIGVVSHSGGLGRINVMWRAQEAGLGISYEASCGNEADLEFSDYARWLLDDPDTSVIAGFVEGFRSVPKFLALAELAAERGKPIVLIKIGRSESGARAAQSHTAALTGVAGALYGHKVTFISPEQFTLLQSIELVTIVILGGVGFVHGAVLGSAFIIVLPQLISMAKDYLPAGAGGGSDQITRFLAREGGLNPDRDMTIVSTTLTNRPYLDNTANR